MEGKIICCCGAGGWTKVIGWIQAILSGNAAIWKIFQLYNFSMDSLVIYRADVTRWEDIGSKLWGALLGILVVDIVPTLVELILAVILLRGVYTKNPRHLQTWLRYTLICYIIWAICLLILLGIQLTAFTAAVIFTWIAVAAVITACCYWVVATYKEELETFRVSSAI